MGVSRKFRVNSQVQVHQHTKVSYFQTSLKQFLLRRMTHHVGVGMVWETRFTHDSTAEAHSSATPTYMYLPYSNWRFIKTCSHLLGFYTSVGSTTSPGHILRISISLRFWVVLWKYLAKFISGSDRPRNHVRCCAVGFAGHVAVAGLWMYVWYSYPFFTSLAPSSSPEFLRGECHERYLWFGSPLPKMTLTKDEKKSHVD